MPNMQYIFEGKWRVSNDVSDVLKMHLSASHSQATRKSSQLPVQDREIRNLIRGLGWVGGIWVLLEKYSGSDSLDLGLSHSLDKIVLRFSSMKNCCIPVIF